MLSETVENGAAPAATDSEAMSNAATEVAKTVEAPSPSMDDSLGKLFDKITAPRDEGGKFKGENAPAEAVEPAPEKDTTKTEAEAPRAEQATATEKLPVGWKQEDAALWQALDPKAKAYVLEQARAADIGMQKQAERWKPYEGIDEVIGDRKQRWALEGVGPVQGIQRILAAEQFLNERPAEAIAYFAKLYGVNLGGLAQPDPYAAQQPQDPTIAALRAEIDQLKAVEAKRANEQRQTIETSLKSEIEAFKAKPEAAYFDELRTDMAMLLQSGVATTIQDAYDRAMWANPTVRAKVLADQRAAEAKKAASEAEQAKKFASMNVKSGAASSGPKTIEDTLAAVAAKHYGSR